MMRGGGRNPRLPPRDAAASGTWKYDVNDSTLDLRQYHSRLALGSPEHVTWREQSDGATSSELTSPKISG